MSAINGFLKDFMDMRKTINPVGLSAIKGPLKPGVSGKIGVTGPGGKGKITKGPAVIHSGLAHIIEAKPERKEVITYLQERANDMSEAAMA
jgi:hypothetical protein